MKFSELHLDPKLLSAVEAEGYTTPTAIQQQAIPHVLTGRDLVGLAQTGTGKTAAFALPILHRMLQHPGQGHRHIRVLVLAPTRELASQIAQSFSTYGQGTPFRNTVIFGGVGQDKQARALKEGIDILVATPGRLLDLMGQGLVQFQHLEVFVLDEADRMLDMGFIHDVRRIVEKIPKKRQTLLFSATMPSEVKSLAANLLTHPAHVAVHPESSTAERIAQSVYLVDKARKRPLLQHLLSDPSVKRTLVFTRTKQGANRVAEFLSKANIPAEAIHGNKSQGARERALANFASGQTPVLVATDIAARGIDIEEISHVINFEIPNVPETYVHRIGRTARAGAEGEAISLCDGEERPFLDDIERLTGLHIPRKDVPVGLPAAPPPTPHQQRPQHSRPQNPPRPAPASPREARDRMKQSERHDRRGGQQAASPRQGQHQQRHGQDRHGQGQQQERQGQERRHPGGAHHAPAHGQHRPHASGKPAEGHRGQARPQGGRPQHGHGGRPPHRGGPSGS
jgi:ATP-dependent RNA helicase RhlE